VIESLTEGVSGHLPALCTPEELVARVRLVRFDAVPLCRGIAKSCLTSCAPIAARHPRYVPGLPRVPTRSIATHRFFADFRPKIVQMPASAQELGRFLELPYHIVLMRDETGGDEEYWTARVEELPGCEARGETADAAARGISKAMEDWLAAALQKGNTVPEPRTASSHSGRLLLRIPQALHAELAHKADREEVSLNGLITGMLAGAVGWQREGLPEESASERLPGASGSQAPARSRFLRMAIIANIVVVALAALAAIALLIVAWQNGW
jgi:antitoxin HicB